ncbi:MAG: ABC transporter permease [Alphaproteobacteria bacterium]|nr:ABC transporter permease [Alphaproteobacteria bacterium]
MGMNQLIVQSLYETVAMVFGSTAIGLALGIYLGTTLFNMSQQGLKPNAGLYESLSFLVNSARSIPYIILTVLLIPVTRFLIGTSIGTGAAIIPLSIAAVLLIARCTEDALQSVPKGLIEVGHSLGAKPQDIIWKIIFPEALPPIISGVTTVMINIVGYSAMAGTVGGGGLGDLAIRYGYQRYDTVLMVLIVVIIFALVQAIQMIGQWLTNKCRH